MVFHDWDLRRLLGVEGETESFMADELEEMRYPGTNEGPVALDKLLELVGGQVAAADRDQVEARL